MRRLRHGAHQSPGAVSRIAHVSSVKIVGLVKSQPFDFTVENTSFIDSGEHVNAIMSALCKKEL